MSQVKRTFKNRINLLTLALSLPILILAPLSWNFYDIRYFIEWYNIAWRGDMYTIALKLDSVSPPLVLTIPFNILRVYVEADKVAYPPLPVIIFVTTYSVARAAANIMPIVRLIAKLPLIIAYFAITYLLDKNYGAKARILWLINGFSSITIFSYQLDLIAALAILAAYLAYVKNKLVITGLCASIAFLNKPFSIVPLLPIVVKLLYQRNIRAVARLAMSFVVLTTVVVLPFFYIDPRAFIQKAILYHSNRYPQEYSLWAIPIYISNYDFTKIPHLLVWIWTPIYFVAIATVALHMLKTRDFSELNILKNIVIISLLSLLINKIGNLNYFTWYLPLVIIYIVETKLYTDKHFLTIYLSIPAAVGTFAGFFTFYAALIVGEPIIIIEDQALYSPYIAERSFDPNSLSMIIAEYFRKRALWFFKPLYEAYTISYIIYTILCSFYTMYLLLKTMGVRIGARV